jgi:tetratricopeptide (TPR) repeat protein
LAYVAVADAYSWLGVAGHLPYRDAFSRAKDAAAKALEIDEALPGGHTALAEAVGRLDWDWAGAERGYRRALELDPNSADAHMSYGTYLSVRGLSQEGIEHGKRAVELDPLSSRRHVLLVIHYFFARRFDQALDRVRKAEEVNPDLNAHFFLGWIYREQGRYEEAIAEFREALEQGGNPIHTLGHLGNAYARAGRVTRESLRGLREHLKEGTVGVYEVALIYAGLGERDRAFEWLEKAYEAHDNGMVSLKVDPALDSLRSDPRFQDLLRRMNFPQ